MFSELNEHKYCVGFIVGDLWDGYFIKLHAMLDALDNRVTALEESSNIRIADGVQWHGLMARPCLDIYDVEQTKV